MKISITRGLAALSVAVAATSAHALTGPSVLIVADAVGSAPIVTPAVDVPQTIGVPPGAPAVGLLLPAVQKVRAAAARIYPATATGTTVLVTGFDTDTGAARIAHTIDLPYTNATPGGRVREAAARTKCQNNLRQLGLGVTGPVAEAESFFFAPGAGSTDSMWEVFVDPNKPRIEFNPFGVGNSGGVHIATGDVTGDGLDDLIVSAGPGGGPHVKVFNGRNHDLLADFFAYDPNVAPDAVTVAAGDLNGDGIAEIILGSSLSTGPQVHTFNYADVRGLGVGAAPSVASRATFFDLNTPGTTPFSTRGVYVTAGDLDGDGRAEIIANAYSTPIPGATNFAPSFYKPLFNPAGGSIGYEPLAGLTNPFTDYSGGIVAIPGDVDPATRAYDVVFTAFSGFIPEPSAALPTLGALLLLASRRRQA